MNPVNRIVRVGHSRVRQLDKKIDPDLFARLMQLPARARKDLLEYIGQGPMAVPPPELLSRAGPGQTPEAPVAGPKSGPSDS